MSEAQFQLINFQIYPYTDDITDYINQLSSDEILGLFNSKHSGSQSNVLTAALFRIYVQKYPDETISTRNVDKFLFSHNLNELKNYPHVLLLTRNGIYLEHIYYWIVDNKVTNVVGFDELHHPDIFLDGLLDLSETLFLRILQPDMKFWNILNDYKFFPLYAQSDNFSWLLTTDSLGETPLTSGLIFRKYDYVRQL